MSDLINLKKNNIQPHETVVSFYISFATYICYFIATLVCIGCPILYNCKIAQSGILTGIYNNVTISRDRGYCSPFNTVSQEKISNEPIKTTEEDEKEKEKPISVDNNYYDIPLQKQAILKDSIPNIPTDVIVFLLK